MREYLDDDGNTVLPRSDKRKPRPKGDLTAERLSALRLEWLAERLLKMSEAVSDIDRTAAAAAILTLARTSKPRPAVRDNSKPGSKKRIKATEFEYCAIYIWHQLRADAVKHGRIRWNDDQRSEAASLAIKRAESVYPLQKETLSTKRLMQLVDRPLRSGDVRRIKLWKHFESLSLLDGFVFSVPKDKKRALRAKPHK